MIRIVTCLIGSCALVGCATSSDRPTTQNPGQTNNSIPGIVVEQWRFQADDGRLDAAISELIPDDTSPLHGEEGFRHEGFRVVILDSQGAQALQESLESESPARRIRHGEALAWRDLLTRTIDQSTVILENGRARRLPRSVMGLAARGWSIPTIDGAAVHIQVVPHLIAERVMIRPAVQPGELRGRAMANPLEATLDADSILIVTSAPALRTTDEDSNDQGSNFFPSTGPNAPLPPTVAELLLDSDNGRTRGILVIRGIPNSAFKPPARKTP